MCPKFIIFYWAIHTVFLYGVFLKKNNAYYRCNLSDIYITNTFQGWARYACLAIIYVEGGKILRNWTLLVIHINLTLSWKI